MSFVHRDTITNGIPGPGAGNIETPGARDIYTLTASAGQQIYVQIFPVAYPAYYCRWRMADPSGKLVFDEDLVSGYPAPLFTLTNAGTYTITVGSDQSSSTGPYAFKLWNVPPPDRFAISIGDTVTNGVPGPGAGNIETPGAEDIYTLTASAGQQVYFSIPLSPNNPLYAQGRCHLVDPNGTVIFDQQLDGVTPECLP